MALFMNMVAGLGHPCAGGGAGSLHLRAGGVLALAGLGSSFTPTQQRSDDAGPIFFIRSGRGLVVFFPTWAQPGLSDGGPTYHALAPRSRPDGDAEQLPRGALAGRSSFLSATRSPGLQFLLILPGLVLVGNGFFWAIEPSPFTFPAMLFGVLTFQPRLQRCSSQPYYPSNRACLCNGALPGGRGRRTFIPAGALVGFFGLAAMRNRPLAAELVFPARSTGLLLTCLSSRLSSRHHDR